MTASRGERSRPIPKDKLRKQVGLIKQLYQAYGVLQQADSPKDKAFSTILGAARGERQL